MADEPNNPSGGGNTPENKPTPTGGGDNPGNGDGKGGGGGGAIDIKSLTPEQLKENPHFAGLLRDAQDERTKRQKIEDDQKAADQKALEEQGRHKELAEQRGKDLETANATIKRQAIFAKFILEAGKANIVDPEAAFKIADLSNVKVGDDGITVEGLGDVIKNLTETKPYLVGKPGGSAPKVGDETNPAGDGDGKKRTYKRSELRDAKFFEDNKADILLAHKEGRIEDDING